jgi:16S rRNA (guanine1207-N2)-methyltransferase
MTDVLHILRMPPELREHFLRKMVAWKPRGADLRLEAPVDTFSGFQIDRGTRRLLRAVETAGPRWASALDLGCGYGPVALFLAASGIVTAVDAVDRDALAAAATQANAAANALAGGAGVSPGRGAVTVRGALAYDGLAGRKLDAVVSNLPAKAGRPVHRHMLLAAADHLAEGGQVWIVVVAPLAAEIDAILADGRADVFFRHGDAEHVVRGYRLPLGPAVPADDPYLRGTARFQWHKTAYSLTAMHNLPEFDNRSWETDVLAKAIGDAAGRRVFRSLAVVEPGQGHLAILAAAACKPLREMTVVSRDLLALRATRRNLADNRMIEPRLVHAPTLWQWPEAPLEPDLIVTPLREKEGMELHEAKLRGWCKAWPDCEVIAGAKGNFASRLEVRLRKAGLRVADKVAKRGFWALTVRTK